MFELRYVLVAPPASEPVSVADVREFLRIDDDDDSQDGTIAILIAAARKYAEGYTGRSLITQTWKGVADGFPGAPAPAIGRGVYQASPYPRSWEGAVIELRHAPVSAVTSISYVDSAGVPQTLDPAAYAFDPSEPPRLAPAFGQSWPAARSQLASVQITFTAGYSGDGNAIPATVRNWILVRIATAYENREEASIVARGKMEPNHYVDGLLDIEKVSWL